MVPMVPMVPKAPYGHLDVVRVGGETSDSPRPLSSYDRSVREMVWVLHPRTLGTQAPLARTTTHRTVTVTGLNWSGIGAPSGVLATPLI
jgi:hypothetical protein